ncbi:TetR/AcrR family transcriptional regulator [Streptomyces johnsoniae]|uniref:TetR/AcrR family transcriptional regulator n=1 Tax=Streptomyces johnsoniae TaxID=3075532 RepID=A0ABU2S203_9ACTN|nr:TetR/AcrR family transcriptional regulator [Streptomyces sp. DSM 41886]MDT0443034.1 TetR/AcrR family transcriptional regulator [Streptomyces sp. DSM 41886]
MGSREDLLEGAKRCLSERGYARTTARDIVAAAPGTHLASIGYHYGSKEALLDAALMEAIAELSDLLGQLSTEDPRHLPDAWQRSLAEFDEHKPLLIAHVEAWSQIQRSPQLREQFARLHAGQVAKGIERTKAVRPGLDTDTARAVTTVSGALADGLIVQWLIDPEQLPSGHQIAAGLRALADMIDTADD